MRRFISEVKKFVDDEDGVTAIEYGLIAALIAVAIVGAVGDLGQTLKNVFVSIATALT